MLRPADRDRIHWLLQEQGGTSNQQVRSILNLSKKRYDELKEGLIDEGLIEKYRCRGGGVQLTKKGETGNVLPENQSAVEKERDLYPQLVKALEAEAKENEELALVVDCSALRKRGKWSNPDVTKISVRSFPILRTHRVLLATYELKQWPRWNVEAVFEAASHRRFAHESYVVLEWAKHVQLEGLEELASTCGEFGVGLITLQPYRNSFRHRIQLDADVNVPSDDLVEEFLEYLFERRTKQRKLYDALWDSFDE